MCERQDGAHRRRNSLVSVSSNTKLSLLASGEPKLHFRRMARKSLTQQQIDFVWNLAPTSAGEDPAKVRRCGCRCGKKIVKSQRTRDKDHAWEVDHTFPHSKGGSDNIANWKPLHWKCNAAKSNKLNWSGLQQEPLKPGIVKSKNVAGCRDANHSPRKSKR